MELLRTRDPIIPIKPACQVLGVSRATAQRHLAPPVYGPRRRPRPTSHRKFALSEEQVVLDTLHSERFQDQSPRQVYAELLDEGKYGALPEPEPRENQPASAARLEPPRTPDVAPAVQHEEGARISRTLDLGGSNRNIAV